MKKKAPLRLAVAALTDNVYVGRLTKDGTCFLDSKQDVTQDFYKAVIDRFCGSETTITSSDGEVYMLTCKRTIPETGGVKHGD